MIGKNLAVSVVGAAKLNEVVKILFMEYLNKSLIADIVRFIQNFVKKKFNHGFQMQVMCCCLLEEVILQLPTVSSWLPVLQENLVISSLLSSVEYFIKVKNGDQHMMNNIVC
jgi:hypothetical protein